MELSITTNNGTFKFFMKPENVGKLLASAFSLSEPGNTKETPLDRSADKETEIEPFPPRTNTESDRVPEFKPVKQHIQIPAPPIRKLAGPGIIDRDGTEETMEQLLKRKQANNDEDGYSGFLHIKCEKCGNVHTYCSKEKIRYSKCMCNHSTRLTGLKRAFVECKCGGTFRYFTNITDDQFEIDCYKCGSPVDMELNSRRQTFITMKDHIHRGGGHHS